MMPRGRLTKKQLITEASKVPGVMPLDYMLSVIRDPTANQERRDRLAIAAAPYCHAKLSDDALGKKDAAVAAAKQTDGRSPFDRVVAVRDERAAA